MHVQRVRVLRTAREAGKLPALQFIMIFVFYLFAAVLVFLSYKSFRGGIDYLNFYKKELAKPLPDFAPFVSIIAPCRGLDEDLEENLDALFRQNFPRYEVVFVVDSETDDAVQVIQEILNRGDAKTQRNKKRKLCVFGVSAVRKIYEISTFNSVSSFRVVCRYFCVRANRCGRAAAKAAGES